MDMILRSVKKATFKLGNMSDSIGSLRSLINITTKEKYYCLCVGLQEDIHYKFDYLEAEIIVPADDYFSVIVDEKGFLIPKGTHKICEIVGLTTGDMVADIMACTNKYYKDPTIALDEQGKDRCGYLLRSFNLNSTSSREWITVVNHHEVCGTFMEKRKPVSDHVCIVEAKQWLVAIDRGSVGFCEKSKFKNESPDTHIRIGTKKSLWFTYKEDTTEKIWFAPEDDISHVIPMATRFAIVTKSNK